MPKAKIFKGRHSDFALELVSKDAAGHPSYNLRRLTDNAVVASIKRYEGSKQISGPKSVKGRGYIRQGKTRTFWQWSFDRDQKPSWHLGRTSTLNDSCAYCATMIISYLERDF